jgi:hypothetical protein
MFALPDMGKLFRARLFAVPAKSMTASLRRITLQKFSAWKCGSLSDVPVVVGVLA